MFTHQIILTVTSLHFAIIGIILSYLTESTVTDESHGGVDKKVKQTPTSPASLLSLLSSTCHQALSLIAMS